MDTPHWPQFGGGGMEGGSSGCSKSNNNNNNNNNNLMLERKTRPQKEQALNCPRCNSSNTKFCYYNNYSLSQPRYFCKACRRYWTEGGSLRNVPVGGGSRKNKRSSLSSSSSGSTVTDHKKINGSDQNPNTKIIIHHPQDLNLAIFPPNTSSSSHLLGSFMGVASAASGGGGGGGFGLHDELKPSLSFSLEGFESGGGGGGYGNLHHHHHHHHQDQTAVMFPIEDLKQTNGAAVEFDHQNKGVGGGDSGGYWNGMLGGGSW